MPGEVVLEVGPGPGLITGPLLAAGARVLAVEIDRDLAALLEDLLGDDPGLTVLRTDILRGKHRIDPAVREALDELRDGGPWRVIANLPYQIASPFTADLVGLPVPPREILVMVQAEVADRMLAGPGSGDYGPLAATLALAATGERRRDFPPDVFWPRPRVRSSLVRIVPDPARRDRHGDWAGLQAFLRDAFLHRRKTLRQGLILEGWAPAALSEAMGRIGCPGSVRAEAVAPERLAALWSGLGAKGETRAASRRRRKGAE